MALGFQWRWGVDVGLREVPDGIQSSITAQSLSTELAEAVVQFGLGTIPRSLVAVDRILIFTVEWRIWIPSRLWSNLLEVEGTMKVSSPSSYFTPKEFRGQVEVTCPSLKPTWGPIWSCAYDLRCTLASQWEGEMVVNRVQGEGYLTAIDSRFRVVSCLGEQAMLWMCNQGIWVPAYLFEEAALVQASWLPHPYFLHRKHKQSINKAFCREC